MCVEWKYGGVAVAACCCCCCVLQLLLQGLTEQEVEGRHCAVVSAVHLQTHRGSAAAAAAGVAELLLALDQSVRIREYRVAVERLV
jgi:hypothetical protein